MWEVEGPIVKIIDFGLSKLRLETGEVLSNEKISGRNQYYDFNSIAEKSEAWTIMIEGGLKDAWLVAPLRRGPAATFGAWIPVDPQSDRRIDWILFRGPVHPESIVAIEDNVDGRFPSDHLPVQARLILED